MQETFDEALWPRHLEYRESALTSSDSNSNLHIVDAEQSPAQILADVLRIVDPWVAFIVARGHYGGSDEKATLVAREMDKLEAASTAAEKKSKRAKL